MKKISEIIEGLNKALDEGQGTVFMGCLRSLSTEPLRLLDYQKLDRFLQEKREAIVTLCGVPVVRVAILGDVTTQPIAQSMRLHWLLEGVFAEVYEATYNTFRAEIMDDQSQLYRFAPTYVILATTSRMIFTWPSIAMNLAEVGQMAEAELNQWRGLWHRLKQRTGAIIFQHTFEPYHAAALGRLEFKYPGSRAGYVQELNRLLWKQDGQEVFLIDVHALASAYGIEKWADPRWYYHGKYLFDPNLIHDYARLLQATFRAATGRSKKCLVIDLDNTLWGGVIGDDGLGGIDLGNISATGEAYYAFCTYIKALSERGVIVAVNSKNDEGIAKSVFIQHPEMPLKLNDFSAFYANWNNKVDNLAHIARDLNIGLDSIVFVDDNPVECAQVSAALPEVVVIELKGDPAYFIRTIEQTYYFDQEDITAEDMTRATTYQVQHQLREAQSLDQHLDDFLKGLNMTAAVVKATEEDLARIEQIFKKTNQFNLTGQKFEREALQYMLQNVGSWCLACRLKDKFVDYGLMSAVVGNVRGSNLCITNWVMSCRVFSRTFEEFIFNTILELAQQEKCTAICGSFVPTSKNAYAKPIFKRLGFTLLQEDSQRQEWQVSLQKASRSQTFILAGLNEQKINAASL